MNSSDMPLTKDTWRSWISTRAQELKQDTPSRSKKDCWRTKPNGSSYGGS
jgi:hypothetical protein